MPRGEAVRGQTRILISSYQPGIIVFRLTGLKTRLIACDPGHPELPVNEVLTFPKKSDSVILPDIVRRIHLERGIDLEQGLLGRVDDLDDPDLHFGDLIFFGKIVL